MAGKIFRTPGFISLGSILFMTLVSFNCDKEKPHEFVEMTFVIPFEATPVRSIEIGDTLWMQTRFPDTVLELNSMKYYKLINMDFEEYFVITRLAYKQLTLAQQPGAFGSFLLVEKMGRIERPGVSAGDLKFAYNNDHYSFKMGFIPTQLGVHCFNFLWPFHDERLGTGLDLENYIDLGFTADGRKRVPVHRATYVVINDGSTNFDLFQTNCRATSIENPVEGLIYFEQKGTYTFEVVK